MKNCEIKDEKSKVIRIDPETVWLLKQIRSKIYIYWNDLGGISPTEQQVIKAALIEYLNEIDNVIKKE